MSDPYKDVTNFDRTIAGSPYLLREDLTAEELQRVKKEMTYWKFYKGKQWAKERIEGEAQNTTNYCRAFVDKGVSFLMGKGFNIDTKPEAREITKPLLDEVWEDNSKYLTGLDLAQAGGVTGNTFVKVAVERFDEKEFPTKAEIYPNGRIRIIVLPSYSVFPKWHPHDKDRMVSCKIMYPIMEEVDQPDGTVKREQIWYKEVITRDKIVEYYGEKKVNERENSLNEIPVVRIKNLPMASNPLGQSDLADIVPLQRELNLKTTDVSDIINYHAAPITIIKGAKASNLEKGSRKIWGGLPKDADVFNLELETDLKAAMDYIEMLKNSMFELGNMPEDAFGSSETKVSNTSGVALHIKNQPLMEQTKVKQATYGEGIKEINRLIIKYAEMIEHPSFDIEAWEGLNPRQKYWSETEFENPLPKDELINMQLIAQKIKLMLMSREDALRELGEDDAEEKLAEIVEEAKVFENLIYDGDVNEEDMEALKTNLGGVVRGIEKAKDEVDINETEKEN